MEKEINLNKIIDDFNKKIDKIREEMLDAAINATRNDIRSAYIAQANKYEIARRIFNQFFEDGTIRID